MNKKERIESLENRVEELESLVSKLECVEKLNQTGVDGARAGKSLRDLINNDSDVVKEIIQKSKEEKIKERIMANQGFSDFTVFIVDRNGELTVSDGMDKLAKNMAENINIDRMTTPKVEKTQGVQTVEKYKPIKPRKLFINYKNPNKENLSRLPQGAIVKRYGTYISNLILQDLRK